MHDDGIHVGLLGTGIPDFYRRMGWENAGLRHQYAVDCGNVELLPEPRLTRESGPEVDASEVLELYDSHGLGARRDEDEFAAMLGRPDREVYVARDDSVMVAYLVTEDGTVFEYGGDTRTAAALVRALYEDRCAESDAGAAPNTKVDLDLPPLSGGLPGMLGELGIPRRANYLGMLMVIRPAELFEAMGLDGIVVEEDDGHVTLSRGEDSVELTGQALTKLVFGPEYVADFAPEIFPLTLVQWRLDRI
jgi:hypothetical protein